MLYVLGLLEFANKLTVLVQVKDKRVHAELVDLGAHGQAGIDFQVESAFQLLDSGLYLVKHHELVSDLRHVV